MSLDLLGQLEATLNQREVSITEFAESHEFCGRILYPRQKLLLKLFFLEDLTPEEDAILDYWIAGGRGGNEITISPHVRERIQWLKENGYKHFREVVLVGGRRCSKGFVTGLSLAKKAYDTLQLQDPGRFYGIDRDKEIVFSCVAAAEKQAKEMQYADFSAMVNSCNAMRRHVSKMQELEFSLMTETDLRQLEAWKREGKRVMKDTSTIRGRALPANSRTIRGSATMAIVFDEFAHFQQGESDQSDAEVYAAATPALAQFGTAAMIFANSSPYSKVGKFYERFEAGMATDNDGADNPTVLSVQFPSWALFEGWWEDPTYIGPKKCITVSPDWNTAAKKEDGSDFYTQEDQQAILIAKQEESDDPEKFKVERRGKFAEVIDAYLMPERVDQMFMGMPTNDFDPTDGFRIYIPLKTNTRDSTYQFRYTAHLDPSSTTAGFGFALGHTEILTVDAKSEHHVVFDIIKRWNPRDFPEGVIEWDPILSEVMFYIDIFRPYQLTMDQFNSAYPIQWLRRELRRRRIHDTHVFEKTANAQSNWDRAEIFRTALYQSLVHAPSDQGDCTYAADELKYLQEIKTGRVPRVEKQDIGPVQTKDMADCIMVVTEDLIGNMIGNQIRSELATEGPRLGAQGGYPLGGHDRMGKGLPSPLAEHYAQRKGEQSGVRSSAREQLGSANPARGVRARRPNRRRFPGS